MRLFNPRAVKALQRFDAFAVVVLHTAKDDLPASWRFDPVDKAVEMPPQAMPLYLVLDEKLGAVLQILLHLAYANRAQARVHHAFLYQQLREEMRLAGTATAVRALVTRGV